MDVGAAIIQGTSSVNYFTASGSSSSSNSYNDEGFNSDLDISNSNAKRFKAGPELETERMEIEPDVSTSSSSSSSTTTPIDDDGSDSANKSQVIEIGSKDVMEATSKSNNNSEENENNSDDDEFDDDGSVDDESVDENLFFNVDFDDHFGEAEAPPPPPKPEKKPEELEKTFYGFDKFSYVLNAPDTHKFVKDMPQPVKEADFKKAFQRETKLLQEGLPNGIFVKAYEDRMDLFSALIIGPENTPYDGSLFAFDIKLPNKYPHIPPEFYFISFTKERMNPNLYATCGKVCVSLLGTWEGSHKCEKWSADSSILQVLLSIQALILVPEPFFNEPGCVRNPNNPSVAQQSRTYTETATLLLLNAMSAMLENPPRPWQFEVIVILRNEVPRIIARLESWLAHSNKTGCYKTKNDTGKATDKDEEAVEVKLPEYPLLPIIRQFEARVAIRTLKANHAKFGTI